MKNCIYRVVSQHYPVMQVSGKTMRSTAILPLILGCLLHITWGSPSDSCFRGEVLPINVREINDLWNLKALAAHPTLTAQTVLNKVHYSYAKISLTEKEGTITEFFNPIEGIYGGPIHFQRVEDDKKTLTYRKDDKEAPILFTFLQLEPNVLIVNRHSNGNIQRSSLYVRSFSKPELKLEDFKEWSKCKELTFYKEFNNTVNYAQKCYRILEEKSLLHLENTEDIFTSWHLLAKSSTSMDRHYNLRILYTARLEISREEGEPTIKEIITAPKDNIIFEQKFGNPDKDGNVAFIFKTKEGLLLLGVQTKTERTLYLASKTPTVKQSVMDKFEAQALCMETKFNYFIPGSIRENDGDEVCAPHLKQWEATTFQQSLGKWILVASAYKDIRTALVEQYLSKQTEYTAVNNEVHQTITLKSGGTTVTTRTAELDVKVGEKTGDILFINAEQNKTTIHMVSPSCSVFSYKGRRLLNCRPNQLPPINDIIQFAKFATCQDLNKIFIHQSFSSLCSETPTEVQTLDVEKIAGTWNLAAVASNVPEGDVKFPHETQFIVKDGEVTMTDGTWSSTAKKIGANRLQYTKGDQPAMEMRFLEPLGDSLLTWVGNPRQPKTFLILFSKSDLAEPDELIRFKQFAACSSIPEAFVKE